MKLALAAALVIAHFTATSVSGTATRTCGTVTATNATYSGAGTTIVARSTIDARAGGGVVTGTLRAAGLNAQFSAVYAHGAIDGTAWGHMGSHTLVASLSALFSPTGGFTRGVLGGRGSGGSVVLGHGCGAPPQRVLRHASGIVKVASADQVAIGGLTCAVPAPMAITLVVKYQVGSRAAITCSVSNGRATLVTIRATR